MKTLTLLATLAFTLGLDAQTTTNPIDSLAKNFLCPNCRDLKPFTELLTQPYSEPQDKARAIYAWIGTHVRYDYQEAKKLDKRIKFTGSSLEEIEQKKRIYFEEKIPNETFRSRKGICQDYSYLFKQMCSFVGLECVVISGHTKSNSPKVSKVGHAWNAVKLKDQWHLLDATWGAGYVEKGKFHRAYSPGYFLSDPRLFILNHLPDDEKWQLLEKPLSESAFKKQAWVNYGDSKYLIEAAEPLDGPLIKLADQVEVRLKFAKKPPVLLVMGKGKKTLPYQESKAEGYTVLKFRPKSNTEIEIMGGKSRTGMFVGLAKFYVE
jgi:hypothetical protein